jgi:endonuclease/exonuclease/phosphatase family metal-dependent hydrolase
MNKNSLSFIMAGFLFVISGFPLKAQPVQPKEENSIRMMSYNVRNGTGMDNITDYQRIADVINQTLPDIVALQELDSATVRSRGVYVLKELAERTLMHYTYAPAIDFQGGKYGIGILSKEKPIGFRQISLPGNEKRTFLVAEFSRYFFCCTHLALEQENREHSVSIILETVKDIQKPLFLAGDMNAAYNSPELKALSEKFTLLNDSRKNTFPADKPDQCIDFIYGIKNDGYSVLGQGVLNESQASDHRPLYVDVHLKASVENTSRTKPYMQNPVDNGITIAQKKYSHSRYTFLFLRYALSLFIEIHI